MGTVTNASRSLSASSRICSSQRGQRGLGLGSVVVAITGQDTKQGLLRALPTSCARQKKAKSVSAEDGGGMKPPKQADWLPSRAPALLTNYVDLKWIESQRKKNGFFCLMYEILTVQKNEIRCRTMYVFLHEFLPAASSTTTPISAAPWS